VEWRKDRHVGPHARRLPARHRGRPVAVAVLTVRDAEFTIDFLAVDRAGPPVETFEAPG
jgi:hypothetical protein